MLRALTDVRRVCCRSSRVAPGRIADARQEVLACAHRAFGQRRVLVNARHVAREPRRPRLSGVGLGEGIGPVGHPVGAHAAGESRQGVHHLLNLRRRRLPATREQVLAVALSCLELGAADPSCCRRTFGIAPLLVGSGNFSTPWLRMQREKATGSFCFADVATVLEEELVCVVAVVEPSCAT